MKKIVILSWLAVLLLASPALAHTLKTDGSIGVLLHLDPDDNPIVSLPANFYFEIKDKNNRFTPEACNCQISILDQDREVFASDLFVDNSKNNISSSVFSYTFTNQAIYKVIVKGIPKSENSFQSFQVQFDVRVSGESGQSDTKSSSWLIIGGTILIGVVVLSFIFFKKK